MEEEAGTNFRLETCDLIDPTSGGNQLIVPSFHYKIKNKAVCFWIMKSRSDTGGERKPRSERVQPDQVHRCIATRPVYKLSGFLNRAPNASSYHRLNAIFIRHATTPPWENRIEIVFFFFRPRTSFENWCSVARYSRHKKKALLVEKNFIKFVYELWKKEQDSFSFFFNQ